MKASILFLFLITSAFAVRAQAPSYALDGFHISDNDSGLPQLLNVHGVAVDVLDASLLDTKAFTEEILNSEIEDRLMIVKILGMYQDRAKLVKELLNLGATYEVIGEMLDNHIAKRLAAKYSAAEIEALKSRTE